MTKSFGSRLLYLFMVALLISACSAAGDVIGDSRTSLKPVSPLVSAFHGVALFSPILIFGGILAFALTIPSISAAGLFPFGRRKRRDLSAGKLSNVDFDFNRFLTREQSKALISLAAFVDSALDNYFRHFA